MRRNRLKDRLRTPVWSRPDDVQELYLEVGMQLVRDDLILKLQCTHPMRVSSGDHVGRMLTNHLTAAVGSGGLRSPSFHDDLSRARNFPSVPKNKLGVKKSIVDP